MKSLLHKIDDMLNPVLVKELRQATHGKFMRRIILGLLMFLFISMAIVLLTQSQGSGSNMQQGGDLFSWFLFILCGCVFLGISNWSSNRFASERDSNSMELLYASTIRPSQIIAGKFLTGVIVAIQLYSICLPFMVICYLLRGIDVQTILMSTAATFVLFIPILLFSIFIGSLPISSKSKRSLNGFIFIFLLWFGSVGVVGLLFNGNISFDIRDENFWIGASTMVGLCGVIAGLLFMLSVAAISPASSNRVLPVRLYISIVWIVFGVIMTICSFIYNGSLIFAWYGVTTVVACIGMLITASERVALGGHIRKQIPKKWIARVIAFPHFSGVASGFLYFISIAVMSAVVATLVYCLAGSGSFYSNLNKDDIKSGVAVMLGVSFITFVYSLIGAYTKHRFCKVRFKKTSATVISLFFIVLSILVPIALILVIHAGHVKDLDEYPLFFVLSTIGVFFDNGRNIALVVDVLLAFIVAACALPALLRSWREFKPCG